VTKVVGRTVRSFVRLARKQNVKQLTLQSTRRQKTGVEAREHRGDVHTLKGLQERSDLCAPTVTHDIKLHI
jgi:hypothetical protein